MERTEKGTFAKGHKGMGGRPPKEREDKYYEITLNTVTYEQWRKIVKRAATLAENGDPVARKWLADYLQGPPVQKTDITSNGESIKGYIGINPDDWDKPDAEK